MKRQEGSSSFLKKRTKKLLPKDKSFLVLFFKKELLPSFGTFPW